MLALIFLYTFNIYRKGYLKLWSLSWWSLALYMFTTAVVIELIPIFSVQHPLRASLTVLSICFAYLQTLFLALGTWELVKERKFDRSRLWPLIGIALILAIVTALLYVDEPGATMERHFVRVSLRATITGFGFIFVGFWILKMTKGMRSLGKKLLSIVFIIYGLQQLNYFISGVLPFFDVAYELPYKMHLGLIDFFLQSLMGVSMLFWLLENERRDLEKANADLDSFFYSTSHDLRSPIASILGLTYLARLEDKNPDTTVMFEKIESRVKKLDEVINDILNYSKNTKRKLSHKTMDFTALLDEVIEGVEFNQGASQIRLIYDREQDTTFIGDPDRLSAIMNNLISNAVRYHDLSKEDPYIKVIFEKTTRHILITVEDNGTGIEEKHHEKIFEMFFRASNQSQGSGLGLFIVKETVKKLKGSILLKSKKGEGSVFQLTLPNPDL